MKKIDFKRQKSANATRYDGQSGPHIVIIAVNSLDQQRAPCPECHTRPPCPWVPRWRHRLISPLRERVERHFGPLCPRLTTAASTQKPVNTSCVLPESIGACPPRGGLGLPEMRRQRDHGIRPPARPRRVPQSTPPPCAALTGVTASSGRGPVHKMRSSPHWTAQRYKNPARAKSSRLRGKRARYSITPLYGFLCTPGWLPKAKSPAPR